MDRLQGTEHLAGKSKGEKKGGWAGWSGSSGSVVGLETCEMGTTGRGGTDGENRVSDRVSGQRPNTGPCTKCGFQNVFPHE